MSAILNVQNNYHQHWENDNFMWTEHYSRHRLYTGLAVLIMLHLYILFGYRFLTLASVEWNIADRIFKFSIVDALDG